MNGRGAEELDRMAQGALDAHLEVEDEHRLCAREEATTTERKKSKPSAKDLRGLGASARVRRVIPPDGPSRLEGLTAPDRQRAAFARRLSRGGVVTDEREEG